MWEWYRIGLSLGLGIAIGGALAAVLAPRRAILGAVAIGAAAAGAVLGYWVIDCWGEAIAGAVGGVLGTLTGAAVVSGALGRGGTRGGMAVLLFLAALGVAALAFVPFLGYFLA